MLDFLISPASAQTETVAQTAAPAGQGAPKPGFDFFPIMMMVMLAVMYFLMIRPQAKRQKEQREMLGALAKGDEALTGGGLAGRITAIGENYITLEIADGVAVKVQKSAVVSVLPKGSLKNL